MLCLYLQAPFAACRTFTAGWYRPTATFLTPSAAYGLLLNIAGIESRLYEHDPNHDGSAPATLTRPGLPAARLALGVPESDSLAASLSVTKSSPQPMTLRFPIVGGSSTRMTSCRTCRLGRR